MAHQDQVERSIDCNQARLVTDAEMQLRNALRKKEAEMKQAESERREHEQRVFDMLKHLADSTRKEVDAWIPPNACCERAEELVAEFEKRIKEQRGNG